MQSASTGLTQRRREQLHAIVEVIKSCHCKPGGLQMQMRIPLPQPCQHCWPGRQAWASPQLAFHDRSPAPHMTCWTLNPQDSSTF